MASYSDIFRVSPEGLETGVFGHFSGKYYLFTTFTSRNMAYNFIGKSVLAVFGHFSGCRAAFASRVFGHSSGNFAPI